MNKHTPGPWRVGTSGPNGCPTIGTTKGLMVAMIAHSLNVSDQKTAAESDARLISAAPELLEALEEAKAHLDYCGYGDSWERERAVAAKLEGRIESAISKAKGESK